MSLHKRNGIWYYDFMVNGKRFCRTTGERTKAAALKAQERVREEAKAALQRPRIGMSLSLAIDKANSERWKYRKDGDQTVARLGRISNYLGNPNLCDITKATAAQIVVWLRETGASNATINRYLAALKTLLGMAFKEWDMPITPPMIRLLPEEPEERRALTEAELENIIKHLDAETARLVRFLVDTGMRLSEALGLHEEDIRDGCAYLRDSKNGRPRVVPLTARAASVIQEPGKLFRYHKWRYARAFKTAVLASGVDPKGVCLHALRHTCCTALVSRGAGLAAAGAVLGHSTATMTSRYSHLDVATLRKTVGLLE